MYLYIYIYTMCMGTISFTPFRVCCQYTKLNGETSIDLNREGPSYLEYESNTVYAKNNFPPYAQMSSHTPIYESYIGNEFFISVMVASHSLHQKLI